MAKATGAQADAAEAAATVSLKVTLRGARPPIWRRLLVADSMTLDQLHKAIQAVMGWQNSHLHAFDVGRRQYGTPHPQDGVTDERRMTVKAVQQAGFTRFGYTYDFGDNWEHEILIEKTAPKHEPDTLPCCVAGKRAGPPEDCGGVWGYEELRAILADPAHPEHEERLEWVGGRLESDLFDVAAANAALTAAFAQRSTRVRARG